MDTLSAHVASLAGLDLPAAVPPVVRVEAAREVAVVVSRSRAAAREIHLDRAAADGVPVVVRPSGGGAVVLAPGVVAASVLAGDRGERFPEPAFRRFGAAVAAALADCGVRGVTLRGVSDLAARDRKLAGSALRQLAGTVLYQVSVLVDPDLALIERYLPFPSRPPDYRGRRGHADFLTTMRREGFAGDRAAVVAALERRLAAAAAPLQPPPPPVYPPAGPGPGPG